MICGSGGSKSRLAKAAGAEPAGQRSDEKLHAVVARSTFPSENAQNTPFSDHFWKLRCQKNARRCGAKRISKSKVLKTGGLGPLLEVAMSKKCTPLWREANFEVKMSKAPHQLRTTFGSWDVEKVHVVVARSTLRSQNVQNTRGSDHFWRFGCRFASIHYTKLHYTTLHYTTLHYTPLHYTTLHHTALPSTTLHYITLQLQIQLQLQNYTPLHSATLDYITLHSTTLHYTTLHYLPLHFTTLHYTPLHYNYTYDYTTTLHYTKLHYTTLHYTTLHYIPLHSTTLYYITLRYITLNDTAAQIDR